MKQPLRKLVYGQDDTAAEGEKHISHLNKVKQVWNGSSHFGVERVFRLFLVSSKLLFPGIYLDHATRHRRLQDRKIIDESYVIFKTLMPFAMLYFSLWNYRILYFLNIYLLVETLIYIYYKIFLPEHNTSKTYNRSLILLFFNFVEVIASFGVIYAAGNYLNRSLQTWTDALYFSFITGSTIGYGDIYPVTENGKWLVMMQLIITISFLMLFFNFFAPKIQDRRSDDPGMV